MLIFPHALVMKTLVLRNFRGASVLKEAAAMTNNDRAQLLG